ncbi:tyrosine-type recombinase/integrase [Turicimonas muris]
MQTNVTLKNYLNLPDGTYTISSNLILRVRGGTRSFIFRYRLGGKRFDKTLGSAKRIGLTEAKKLADQLRGQLAIGAPLVTERDKRKEEAAKESVPRFEGYAQECIERLKSVKMWKSPKTYYKAVSTVERFVNPVIGSKKITDITRDDILKILEPLWIEKTDTAVHLRGRLQEILAYAVNDGYLEYNPAAWGGNLDRYLPPPSKVSSSKHHEAMPLEELQDKIGCFYPATNRTRQVILFTILTASRVGESVPAKWSEIDWKNKVWSVPPERRKDGKPYPHRVPLSTQSLALLKSIEQRGEYIFSIKDSLGSRYSLRPLLQRMTGSKATMHGFRSTFRDWCAENGISDVLAEKSLMHATGNAVVQAYQRSDLLEQRREVMQAWADTVFAKIPL